jgi:hypothetical protein
MLTPPLFIENIIMKPQKFKMSGEGTYGIKIMG